MRRVYKYGFQIQDDIEIVLPQDAEILHVDVQGHPAFQADAAAAFVWALVNPEARPVTRKFRLAGTGHDLPDWGLSHVGTFQMAGGALVYHLFEVTA